MAGGTEFDYIICGGGTSGCVVAARLAEDPEVTVLLLEAGGNCLEVDSSRMSGGLAGVQGNEHDWNYMSTPQKHANNRQIPLSRGKFLGGSSGANGTLCVRGPKQDYDDWNLPGWSGEEVYAAMRKAETFHGKDWHEADVTEHGTSGPVHTEPHDVALISEKLFESMEEFGLPMDHDMFTNGKRANGCGHATRTVYKGIRTTAAAYLPEAHAQKCNLTILQHSLVSKVNLSKEHGGFRATSVDVTDDAGTAKTYTARREIIVSGGAYCSPPILMRSGIGDRDELNKYGIQCLADLPGVGKNLQDHLIGLVPYETTAGYTNDYKIWPAVLAAAQEEWDSKQTGVLAAFDFGAFGYARLDQRLQDDPEWSKSNTADRDAMGLTSQQPNIEYFATESARWLKSDQFHGFVFITELFAPLSRGTVALSSANPLAAPIIDHNYLSNPLDLTVLAEGVRLGNEIVTQGRGTKDLILNSLPAESQHHKYTTRDQWKEYLKNAVTTCYHPVGTCKMGNADDPDAVLDAKLNVRGVKGLRVADCSVIPKIPNGHTQMPAYAIGEICAEFIKADWKGQENGVRANGVH